MENSASAARGRVFRCVRNIAVSALLVSGGLLVSGLAAADDNWIGDLHWWGSQSVVEAHVRGLSNFQSCTGFHIQGAGPNPSNGGYSTDYWGNTCNMDAYYFVHCPDGYR